MRKIEVCCHSISDVRAARRGGAVRVELCSAITAGGVTPSAGLIAGAVKEKGHMQVNVLVRPREGGFVYTDDEILTMCRDIDVARRLGADGVVIGALTPDGAIDVDAMCRLLAASAGLSVTFHRAFDDLRQDPLRALDTLIALGIPRLLTSGLAPAALQGAGVIKQMVAHAADRIIIMPGSGITAANIANLQAATGAPEYHSTCKDPDARQGAASPLFGTAPPGASERTVSILVGALS